MKNDLISIIIPVYNTPSKYLQQCLDCVQQQTLVTWKCIIINDGSSEKSTIETMNAFPKKDKRFVVINQRNHGQGYARNVGIEASRESYLTFLDSDDYWDLNFLEKLYTEAMNNNADIVCSQIVDFTSEVFCKENPETYIFCMNEIANGKASQIDRRKLARKKIAWSKIYKKEIFNDLRFPVLKNEDIFVVYATLWKASIVYVQKDTCYYYRMRDYSDVDSFRKNKIDSTSIKYIFEAIDVQEKVLDFFINHEIEYKISYFKNALAIDMRFDLRYRRRLLGCTPELLKQFDEKLLLLIDKYGEYFGFSYEYFTRESIKA